MQHCVRTKYIMKYYLKNIRSMLYHKYKNKKKKKKKVIPMY